jgi:glutaminase
LLAGLTAEELALLEGLGTIRTYHPGEKIIVATDRAESLFFLKSGIVHVRLPDGIRLATLTAGMAFGEMALLQAHRAVDITADVSCVALEVPLVDFQHFRDERPRTGERIMRNLAKLLADYLVAANNKVNLLEAT